MLTEKAKAKINLTLDVLGKRADGFHEVEMVMQTVDLSDLLRFQEREDNYISLSCQVPYIPVDSRNLAYRAAEIVRNKFGITKGLHIDIEKNIPVSAGLAGGSSDAAATLRGLNRLWQLDLTLDELAELGAALGSDVPFCVYGGTAIATGRGEIIERLPTPAPLWVVLVKPALAVSTADVYRSLDVSKVTSHPNTARMVDALSADNAQAVMQELGNVLESVTFEMHPEVEKLKQKLLQFGAPGALMSGSGPTVFALAERESRALRIYNALRGFAKEVYLTRFL